MSFSHAAPEDSGVAEPTTLCEVTTHPESKVYTKEEWDSVKESFIEIYHRPRMTLERAMYIMAERYNFHATKAMYKKRISKWASTKSLKREEKDRLGAHAELLLKNGKSLPQYDEAGRVIHWDRVRRQDRNHQKRQAMWKESSTQSKPAPSNIREDLATPYSVGVARISLPSGTESIQRLIFDLDFVLDWRQSVSNVYPWSKVWPYARFRDCAGYAAVGMNKQLITNLWHAATHFLNTLPLVDPLLIIWETFVFWQETLVDRSSIYRHTIHQFLLRTVTEMFPPRHPVPTSICSILEHERVDLSNLQVIIHKRLIDSYSEPGTVSWYLLHSGLAYGFLNEGSFEQAREVCRRLLLHFSQSPTKCWVELDNTLRMLGIVECREGKPMEAMKWFTQILEDEADQDPTYTKHCHVLQDLAHLAEELGDVEQAKKYFYSSFTRSLIEYVNDDADTMKAQSCDALKQLLMFLERHELHQDVEQLRKQYPKVVGELLDPEE